eukprot:991061-Amphidinium_carterae.1
MEESRLSDSSPWAMLERMLFSEGLELVFHRDRVLLPGREIGLGLGHGPELGLDHGFVLELEFL